ncbi:MAG: hypothetical protein V7K41_25235 [Nostoc sp.]
MTKFLTFLCLHLLLDYRDRAKNSLGANLGSIENICNLQLGKL